MVENGNVLPFKYIMLGSGLDSKRIFLTLWRLPMLLRVLVWITKELNRTHDG